MTTFTNDYLAAGQLPAAEDDIFLATAKTLVKNIHLFNTGASTQTIFILVKRGTFDGARYRLQLDQNESADVLEGGESICIESGDSIRGYTTDAVTVDFDIDGVQIT